MTQFGFNVHSAGRSTNNKFLMPKGFIRDRNVVPGLNWFWFVQSGHILQCEKIQDLGKAAEKRKREKAEKEKKEKEDKDGQEPMEEYEEDLEQEWEGQDEEQWPEENHDEAPAKRARNAAA